MNQLYSKPLKITAFVINTVFYLFVILAHFITKLNSMFSTTSLSFVVPITIFFSFVIRSIDWRHKQSKGGLVWIIGGILAYASIFVGQFICGMISEITSNAENSDCEGSPKQLSIGDLYPDFVGSSFDAEELEEDYDKIMQGSISKADGYKHYIIVYTSDHHTISEIEMLLLDKDFAEVDKISLMEYVNPDFASLTESGYDVTEEQDEKAAEVRTLPLKLKPGVKPALRAMEEEA